ncbi:hypothetical protein HZC53_03205 [Candidatus Uhrbacteria bacterium]|nr:hypothetical protein [Candidatus Uhrbacteria bacterium]
MPAPRRPGLVARPVPAAPAAPAAPATPAAPAAAPTPTPAAPTAAMARIPVVLTATYIRKGSELEPPIYKTLGKGGVLLGGAILLFGGVLLAVLLTTWVCLIGAHELLMSLG